MEAYFLTRAGDLATLKCQLDADVYEEIVVEFVENCPSSSCMD